MQARPLPLVFAWVPLEKYTRSGHVRSYNVGGLSISITASARCAELERAHRVAQTMRDDLQQVRSKLQTNPAVNGMSFELTNACP